MRESEILTATTTTESPKAIERHSESDVNSLMAIHRQPCATASEVSLIDLSTAQAHLILSYVHHQHSTSSTCATRTFTLALYLMKMCQCMAVDFFGTTRVLSMQHSVY